MRAIVFEMEHHYDGMRTFYGSRQSLSVETELGKITKIPVSRELYDSLKCGDVVEVTIEKAPK